MKFTDVIIENILTIGEAKFRLDGLGLVLVEGINDDESSADSNGAGKSSVVDAISWCFWGSTARGVSADEIINTAAGKNAKVSVTVDDDGELYRVDRYRKAAKFKNGLFLYKFDPATGEWKDETKGTNNLTQKQVERLLGCSEEVFNAAVYSGQETMPDIPRMTDKQLKLLVEQAAGVDVLAGAYEIAREKLRATAQKRADAQIAYDRAIERVEDAKRSQQRLSDELVQWASNQVTKVAALKQRTTQAVGAFNKAKMDFDATEEQSVRAAIVDCQAKIGAVTGERQREQVLLNDLNQATTALSTAQRNSATAAAQVAAAATAVSVTEQRAARIEKAKDEPCDSCGQPLTADHKKTAVSAANAVTKAAIDKHTAALTAQVAVEGRVAAAEKLVAAAQKGLDDHRASMTDVSGEGDKLRNLQREIQIIDQTKNEIERLRVAAQTIAKQWQTESTATNPFTPAIDKAELDMVALVETVDTRKEAVLLTLEDEKYAQAVADVFAPAGVRAHRLDEATPFLNERTAHYLGSLADGAIEAYWTTLTETKGKGDLREKFSVTVQSENAPTFANLSGGEKRKVRLACALALQDLVATRATKAIELWVGDEVDGALDPAGLERLMGVLEEKARDRGTVLIVSHHDIKDYARKIMTVRRTNGRATVTMS